jgi:hypothetical protein
MGWKENRHHVMGVVHVTNRGWDGKKTAITWWVLCTWPTGDGDRIERKPPSRDRRFPARLGVFSRTVNLLHVFFTCIQTRAALMESKYCCVCLRKLPLSAFLKNPSAAIGSKVYATCITCREKKKKRPAESLLQGQPPSRRSRTIPSPTVRVSLPALFFTDQI